jgi:glutamate racemase
MSDAGGVKIGVYDSGFGGLTVVNALRAAGIGEEIVYFADQAHAPYGDRAEDDLYGLLSRNLDWLARHGVELVVMGCNTSCAIAGRRGWPPPAFRFPIADLIVNGARALAESSYRKVAVVATTATVRSGAYAAAIGAVAPGIEVVEIAAPALVPIVEAGEAASARARTAVEAVVAQFPPGVDAIVYGCTHYPLLAAHFAAAAPFAARIDPAREQARAVAALVAARPIQGTTYYTNGDRSAFAAGVSAWTGDGSDDVKQAEEDEGGDDRESGAGDDLHRRVRA